MCWALYWVLETDLEHNRQDPCLYGPVEKMDIKHICNYKYNKYQEGKKQLQENN